MQNHKKYTSSLLGIVSSKNFLKATLILFILQGVFYALTIKYGIPPDERYHLGVIKLFLNNGFRPFFETQDGLFEFGELTKRPYFLYHYLFSFILAPLSGLSIGLQVVALRLINVALMLSSLLVLVKVGRRLNFSEFVINVSIFIFANSMMFTFLAGSINYDNLFILLSFSSILLLVKVIQEQKPIDLVLWGIVSSCGVLTKQAYFPILVGEVIVLMAALRTGLYTLLKQWFTQFKRAWLVNALLLLSVFVLAFVITKTYVANIVTYGELTPSCVTVHTHEECLDHGLYRRSLMLEEKRPLNFKPEVTVFTEEWLKQMMKGTFGTLSHASVKALKPLLVFMAFLFTLMLAATVKNIDIRNKQQLGVMFIATFYAMVLIYINFGTYVENARVMAVQGRYLFPVLPLFYLLGFGYLEKIKLQKLIMTTIVIILIPLMIIGNVPTYLYKSDPNHYSELGKQIFQFITQII